MKSWTPVCVALIAACAPLPSTNVRDVPAIDVAMDTAFVRDPPDAIATDARPSGDAAVPASDADIAARCTAGNTAALVAHGSDAPAGRGTAESVITVAHVGGTGTYPRVVRMNPGTFGSACPSDACVKQPQSVQGALAPFDEELTVNLRGPMELYDFAVYQQDGSHAWQRVSSWNRCGEHDVTFVANHGGDTSGVWTMCGGNSQSYVTADGTDAAPTATPFAGSLGNGVEVNVLSSRVCTGSDDGSECGFSRGVALHGWSSAQGPRFFAMRARMPRYTGTPHGSYNDAPAIWLLNARVVRTAQYGCNCRGAGASGGCGELDVAELVTGSDLTHASSTVYSFQGAIGTGDTHFFERPVAQAATFVVVFDPSGRIQELRLAPDAFDFGATVDDAIVTGWLARTGHTMQLP